MNEPQQPTEEQLLEALRQIKTEDVVVQTVATLVNLAGQKLVRGGREGPGGGAEGDRRRAPHAAAGARRRRSRPIQNALDQIQMLYVRESPGEAPGDEPPKEEPPPQSKIWTPGS